MITIDDVTYTEDELGDVAKVQVERITQLKEELGQLQMRCDEVNVVITAYANAILESVKSAKAEEVA